MPERIIGILGGMGPEATVDFFREIVAVTPARKDQDHVPVLVYSNPRMPDRASAILYGAESPLPHLMEAAISSNAAAPASSPSRATPRTTTWRTCAQPYAFLS